MTLTMSSSRLPASFEQQGDVRHRLLGLGLDVADAHRLPGVEVLADLPAQVDDAVGHHGLAEIVVEVLFRVGVRVLNGRMRVWVLMQARSVDLLGQLGCVP